MCGRYTSNTEEELIEIKNILNDISYRITQEEKEKFLDKEITPTSYAPVITKDLELKILKWGFIKWDNSGIIFNARSETVKTSKFFSKHYFNNRCVVPAKNYFEWQKNGKDKQKYKFKNQDESIMFFAGLAKIEDDGQLTYTILTRESDQSINFIHDRMPVLLTNDEVDSWLDGKLEIEDLKNYEKEIKFEKD